MKTSTSPVTLDTPFGDLSVEVLMSESSSDHVRAVDEFVGNWPAIRQQLERPLFAYYWDTLTGASESGPRIQTKEQVWKWVSTRRITAMVANGNRYIRMLGRCSWEEEHGLEIHVRNGREIIYVGMFEGRDTIEPPSTDTWNFALKENQATAFAQEFVDDDELEQIAMEVGAPSESRPAAEAAGTGPKAQKRPWWKLW